MIAVKCWSDVIGLVSALGYGVPLDDLSFHLPRLPVHSRVTWRPYDPPLHSPSSRQIALPVTAFPFVHMRWMTLWTDFSPSTPSLFLIPAPLPLLMSTELSKLTHYIVFN